MIANIEKYEDFIFSITSRVPLMRTLQLKMMIFYYFKDKENMTPDLAEEIIFAHQRRGHILLTPDGWAMTKQQYKTIICSHADEHIKIDEYFRLPNMDEECRKIRPEITNLMWMVASQMPKSYNFVVCPAPWYIQYIPEGDNQKLANARLFQLTYIKENEELAFTTFLRTFDSPKEDERKIIRRVCLMEDGDKADMVPRIGFTTICKVDPAASSHFSLVKKYADENESWEDA